MDVGAAFVRYSAFLLLLSACFFFCSGKSTNEDPARLLLKPQDTTVDLNSKVSFFCQAGGNPLPAIVWKRNGKALNQPRFIVESNNEGLSTLRIDQVRDRDNQTEFTCTADNGKGQPDTATSRLIVLAPTSLPRGFPTITENPKLKAVEKGHSATMSCNVQGDPTPKVTWLRDFLPVDMSNKRYSIATLGSPGSLVIQNSEESDEGKYECVAQNSKGAAHSRSAHLYVKVRRVPPHFSIPPRRKYQIMPGDRLNLTCAAVGHPMPKVFWRKGFDENLDGGPDSAPIGKNILNLTNVVQSENYTCVAFSKLGHIEASASVEVKSIPDPPSNVKVHNVTSTSITLEWTPSVSSDLEEAVKHYTVQYKPKYSEGVDLVEKKASEPRAVIDGLEPYTQYELHIMIVTDVGRSAPSRPIEATTAEALPGSSPKAVQSRALAGTSTIYVAWEAPEKRNGRILDYVVYYHTDESDSYEFWKKMNVSETVAHISPVQKDALYTIQVAARNSIGYGPMSPKSQVLTTPGIPGQPTNLKAIPLSGDKIMLTWDPPLYATTDIIQYAVVYESISGELANSGGGGGGSSQEMLIYAHNSPSPKATVENLKPNHNYTFRVIGISSRGRGVPSAVVRARTSPAVPSGSPESVVVEPAGPRALRIIWEPPAKSEQNGLITNYKISWEPVLSGDGNEDADEPGETIVPASKDLQRNRVVDGLAPWTEYKITIAAGTEKGFGPPSKARSAKTVEEVPGPPHNFQVLLDGMDNSSVRLSWDAPPEPNGVLRGYKVFAEELENGKVKKSGSRDAVIDLPPEKTEYVVTDLKPNTEYSFQVSARTAKGDGRLTKATVQKMPPRRPSEPRNFEIRPITVDGTTTDANRLIKAKLTWQAPASLSGSTFKGYTVRYRPTDSTASWEQLTVQHTEATVSDLKLGRTYEFRVAAENEQGVGKEAINSLKTQDGVPDSSPINVTCRANVKATSTTCSWLPPPLENRNGEIVAHECFFVNHDGTNLTFTITTPASEANFKISANHTYQFYVRAKTSKGFGPWSPSVTISTVNLDEIPNPTNVRAQALTNDTALVMWTPVNDPKVKGYRVHYTHEASRQSWQSQQVLGGFSNRTKLLGLLPRITYSLCVSAFGDNVVGDCFSGALIEFKMEPRDVVSNLEADEPHRDQGGKATKTVTLSWDYYSPLPVKFAITGYSDKTYKTEALEIKTLHNPLPSAMYTPPTVGQKSHVYELPVRPFANYSVDVAVVVNNRHFLPQTVNFTTRPTGPPLSEEIGLIRADGSNKYKIKLKPASEEYGPIDKYWIIVVPADALSKASMDIRELMPKHQGNASHDEAWVAADLTPTELIKNGDSFTIGDGSRWGNYQNVPLKPGRKYAAILRAFGNSGNAYTDSIASKEFFVPGALSGPDAGQASAAADQNLWIIGPVVAIVVVAIIIIMICFFLLHRNKKKSLPTNRGSISKVMAPASEKTPMLTGDGYGGTVMPAINGSAVLPYDTSAPDSGYGGDNIEMRRLIQHQHQPQHYPVPLMSSNSGTGFSSTHPPIPIVELATHIDRLKANENLLFSQEYEGIETGQQFTWEYSNMEVNKPKNRYANVIAYDHSRVKLSPLDRIPHSEYINANYIDGYRTKKVYIATQGALPETFADFWRMVWEENSITIVMLTKLEERTRIKCDQYWPTRGSMTYGVITVTIKETHELAHYTIRSFDIYRQGQTEVREIKQLQFTAWPDHGVPEHPTPFLMFLKRVKSINPPEAGPIVVHCSAGVGRTGAFIVIDAQLERLRYENTVDIYGCVAAIRAQRNYMVQTEDQYVFIYDAVLDAVQSGCTEVPVAKLYTHIQKLMQTMDNASAMELEFRQLTAVKLTNARFTSANQACNKQKNRLVNILPFDSTRVCLMPSADGSEGSDYINASFIDGYRRRRAYIATQGPLPNTIDDFWRMLWEHNSTIIVMLTKFREMGREKCCQYWPSDRSERYGSLVVEPIAEYNMPQYVLREFKLTDSRDGQSRTVRHFQYTEWPEQGVPKSSEYFVDFIGQVLKTKEQFGLDGPITVHCSAGVGRTGVFIGLSIVLERMRYECVVDIFTTVKLLRTQRPNMVQSEDQYHFCYQAALEYLGSFDYTMQSYE